MEIALRNEIPIYAGGLGVWAGDMVRSAVALMLPIVAVYLVSRTAYFHQQIDAQGHQLEFAYFWEPERWARPLYAKVVVLIENRQVLDGCWIEGYIEGVTGWAIGDEHSSNGSDAAYYTQS